MIQTILEEQVEKFVVAVVMAVIVMMVAVVEMIGMGNVVEWTGEVC